jgi:hypothetical protein
LAKGGVAPQHSARGARKDIALGSCGHRDAQNDPAHGGSEPGVGVPDSKRVDHAIAGSALIYPQLLAEPVYGLVELVL